MGNGLCNTAARIGGILAPQAPALASFWKPAPLIIFLIIALINLLLEMTILPETKGKPLPDLKDETERPATGTLKSVSNRDGGKLSTP